MVHKLVKRAIGNFDQTGPRAHTRGRTPPYVRGPVFDQRQQAAVARAPAAAANAARAGALALLRSQGEAKWPRPPAETR